MGAIVLLLPINGRPAGPPPGAVLAVSQHFGYEPKGFGFVRLNIPIAWRSTKNIVHGHLGPSYEILETFILNRDRGFDLMKRGRDARHAGRQSAADVKVLVELAFM